ncbi:MAG: hypothetical protein WC364_12855 [Eubacteriales bacterium]|jgi:hypothetical protein
MVEIIKRWEGQLSDKEIIDGISSQLSYNSWGHLVVRIIKNPLAPEEEPSFMTDDDQNNKTKEADTLIVFDKKVSDEIISFCQEVLRSRQQRQIPF